MVSESDHQFHAMLDHCIIMFSSLSCYHAMIMYFPIHSTFCVHLMYFPIHSTVRILTHILVPILTYNIGGDEPIKCVASIDSYQLCSILVSSQGSGHTTYVFFMIISDFISYLTVLVS